MLTVALHYKPHHRHHLPWCSVVVEGIRRHERVNVVGVKGDEPRDADLSLFWSGYFPNVIADCEAKGRPYLLMEKCPWGSGNWQIGWNGFAGRADFRNADCRMDRRHMLPWILEPWRSSGGAAVVFGQCQWDFAARNVTLSVWYRQCVDALKAIGFDVAFRPHPEDRTGNGPRDVRWETGPLPELLNRTGLAVTWTSTAGIEAVCAGVPAIAMDQGSLAWPVAAHGLTASPPIPDRESWFSGLGYTCWTPEEARNGDVWGHLKSGLEVRA